MASKRGGHRPGQARWWVAEPRTHARSRQAPKEGGRMAGAVLLHVPVGDGCNQRILPACINGEAQGLFLDLSQTVCLVAIASITGSGM